MSACWYILNALNLLAQLISCICSCCMCSCLSFCPQGYKPPDEAPSEYQSIPLNKIEDFGVHCKKLVPGLCVLADNSKENNVVKHFSRFRLLLFVFVQLYFFV